MGVTKRTDEETSRQRAALCDTLFPLPIAPPARGGASGFFMVASQIVNKLGIEVVS